MNTQGAAVSTLDRTAIGLSAMCIVHCIAGALMLAVAASFATPVLNPVWHELGLGLAAVLGAAALGRGFLLHRQLLPAGIGSAGLFIMTGALLVGHEADAFAIGGAIVLAVAHWLNSRALGC